MQHLPLTTIRPYIDWLYFYHAWRTPADSEAGRDLRSDAEERLNRWEHDPAMATRAIQAFYPADSLFPTPRQPYPPFLSVGDWVTNNPSGSGIFGLFACTISEKMQEEIERLTRTHEDDYELLLTETLASRLAEATSEYLWKQLGWQGIRPAVGYPCLPEQKLIFKMAEMLNFAEVGIRLTENGAMYPPASVSGLYIQHPDAHYFTIRNDA